MKSSITRVALGGWCKTPFNIPGVAIGFDSTLADLVSFAKHDLLKFRNFGKKSLTELEDLVANKGLTFGMNLAKYKLDKE